jgi:enoyl-CoA hydratase/carnithine racemase
MDTGFIKLDVADHVALVTMDRPPVNAVNAEFHDDLMRVFDTLSDRDDVRVAILTGAGRVFCAGADIKARAGLDPSASRGYSRGQRLQRPISAAFASVLKFR